MARRKLVWGGPLLLAALLWCGPAWAGQSLEIWVGEPARLVLSVSLQPGQAFCLEHLNSIYEAPVRETYLLNRRGELVQTAMESPSAGVFEYHGYDPPPQGLVKLDRPLGKALRLLSASYEHHLLRLGGETVYLAKLAEPGRPLIIKVADIPPPSTAGHP